MSKHDQLIDEYLDLCDEADETPVLNDEGDPNPYSSHARSLRKASKGEVMRVEPQEAAIAADLDTRGEIIQAVVQQMGRSLGDAIGRQIAPIRAELDGLRQEMRAGRQTQEGIRQQMKANRPRGAALTDDEWDEHERNWEKRK